MRMLVRLLPFMVEGESSLEDLVLRSGVGRGVLEDLVQGLAELGVVVVSGDRVVFDSGSRLRAGVVALEAGAGREEVSRGLSWQDFEKLAGRVLAGNGFGVLRGVRVGRRRLQIDVLGYGDGLGVAVDCKRWSRVGGVGVFAGVVERQVHRCREVFRGGLAERLGLEVIVPVVVTLYAGGVRFVRRAPIVPIAGFDDFVRELRGRLGEVRVVRRR